MSAGSNAEAPVREAHADHDGHERDPERRRELEHRSGQERDAQGAHRRPAVVLAHLRDAGRLGLPAIERAQRRQAAYDVEEVAREERQRLPALERAPLRVTAHEPHEERHERQRHEHDRGGDEVDRRDEHEHRDRHDHGEDDLREVAGEGRLERVDAGDRRGRDLGALRAVERGRALSQPRLDEVEPKRRENVARRPPPRHLEAPGRERAGTDDDGEQDERTRHGPERRAVERPCGDAREEHRLREDEQRRRDPQHRVDPEEDAGCARTAEEARIEDAHRSAG